MSKKYLIVKKDNGFKCSTPLDDATFEKLKQAAKSLEAFNTFAFLGNSYVKAKEDFFAYDFTQFNVREVDMFNMFLNALEAIATNANLWEAYLIRNYSDDKEVYPDTTNKKKKSCRGIKDSEFYEKNIEYVVSKVLRNMIAHHTKPYSEIIYDNDYRRQFIVTKEDLLEFGSPNKSAHAYISNSEQDYYDVVEVIKRAFDITEEVNLYMFNFIISIKSISREIKVPAAIGSGDINLI